MDEVKPSVPAPHEDAAETKTVSEETLLAALKLGGRRTLEKIQPEFIDMMKNASNVKGATADIIHRTMEKYKITVEEVCSLFLIYSVLDKTRHEQFEDMLAKKQKRLEEVEEEVQLAKDEVVVATRKFEKIYSQQERMVPLEEFQQLKIEHKKMLEDSKRSLEARRQQEEYTRESETLREEITRLKKQLKDTEETANVNYFEKEKYRKRAKEMTIKINRLEDVVHRLQQSLKSVYDQVAPMKHQLAGNSRKDHLRMKQYGRPHSDPSIQVTTGTRYVADTRTPLNPHPEVVARDGAYRYVNPHAGREERVAGSFQPSPLTSVMPCGDQHSAGQITSEEAPDGVETQPGKRGKPAGSTDWKKGASISSQPGVEMCPVCNDYPLRNLPDDISHITSCKLSLWNDDDEDGPGDITRY